MIYFMRREMGRYIRAECTHCGKVNVIEYDMAVYKYGIGYWMSMAGKEIEGEYPAPEMEDLLDSKCLHCGKSPLRTLKGW